VLNNHTPKLICPRLTEDLVIPRLAVYMNKSSGSLSSPGTADLGYASWGIGAQNSLTPPGSSHEKGGKKKKLEIPTPPHRKRGSGAASDSKPPTVIIGVPFGRRSENLPGSNNPRSGSQMVRENGLPQDAKAGPVHLGPTKAMSKRPVMAGGGGRWRRTSGRGWRGGGGGGVVCPSRSRGPNDSDDRRLAI